MRRNWILFLGLLGVEILFFALSGGILYPFAERFFQFRQHWLLPVVGLFPFALGDVVYLGLGLRFLALALKRKWKLLGRWILLLYPAYQLVWGLLYFRPPLEETLGLRGFVIRENQVLNSLHHHSQKAEAIRDKLNVQFSHQELKKRMEQSLQRTPPLGDLAMDRLVYLYPVKASLFSEVMPWTGILGYFNPFTMEANISERMPATGLPMTLGHEWSHLLGIAREQEANFAAWWIGSHSEDPLFRYASELMCIKSLLHALPAEEYTQEFEKLPPKVKWDLTKEKDFWKLHQHPAQELFAKTNDWFLRLNGQDGTVTYSYFTRLLLAWEAKHSL